jgi:hypothetical protein
MAAAVTYFCALEGYSSPFGSPRFGKIMDGIRRTYCKPVKPKKTFMTSHITGFMDIARGGMLLDWRAVLPMALCFQQLLRGAEAFNLDGGNVSVHAGYFLINVESSKNHPEGFDFNVTIDSNRPHCVGTFLADFILRMGIRLGNSTSFFSCEITSTKGVLKAVPTVKILPSTMRANFKKLISAFGLDARLHASHSCKRGGALAAL